jgi:hypothetical protein
MEEQLQKQLQELLDRKACEDVILRYGRTLDWLDNAGQQDCYWPDATIDYGFFRGAAKEWVPVVMDIESASARRWHVSTGVMVQVNGDNAKSECYGLSLGAVENDQGELVDTLFGGRYLDALEKREGEWRISQRTYIADWSNSFTDGLGAMISSGFTLNVLQIQQPDHQSYRKL